MRKLLLLALVSLMMTGEAHAWVELEDENGNTWDCVGDSCYKNDTKEDKGVEKLKTKGYSSKMTGDPLAFPPQSDKSKDPLAFPAKNDKSKDPLAF